MSFLHEQEYRGITSAQVESSHIKKNTNCVCGKCTYYKVHKLKRYPRSENKENKHKCIHDNKHQYLEHIYFIYIIKKNILHFIEHTKQINSTIIPPPPPPPPPNWPTYTGQMVNIRLQTSQRQPVTKPSIYLSWEGKHGTRKFHCNEFIPAFSKIVLGQKYPREVCSFSHISIMYLYLVNHFVLSNYGHHPVQDDPCPEGRPP